MLAEHCCPFIYIYYFLASGVYGLNPGIACFDSNTLKLMWAEEHPPLFVTEYDWPPEDYTTSWGATAASEMRIYNNQILWGYPPTASNKAQQSVEAWDSGTPYPAGWYVSYNNGWELSFWQALQENTGHTPAEDAYWTSISVSPYLGPQSRIGFSDLAMRPKNNIANPLPSYTDGLIDVPYCLDFFTITDGKIFVLTKYIDGPSSSGAHIYCMDASGNIIDGIKKQDYALSRINGSLESDGTFRVYAVGYKKASASDDLYMDSVFCFSFDGSEFTEEWHYYDADTEDDSYNNNVIYHLGRGYTLLVPKPTPETKEQCIVISMVNKSGGTYEGTGLGGIIDAHVSVISEGVRTYNWVLRVENPTREWLTDRIYKAGDHVIRTIIDGLDTYQDTWQSKVSNNSGHQPPYHGGADDTYWTSTVGTESSLSYMGSFGDTVSDTYTGPPSGFQLREHLECALVYQNCNHYLYVRGNSSVQPSSLYRLNLTTGAAVEELPSITFGGAQKPKLMALPKTKPDPWSWGTMLQMWKGEAHLVDLADLETATHSVVTSEIITPARYGYTDTVQLISPRFNRELKFST